MLDQNAPRPAPESVPAASIPPLRDPLRSELDAIHMRASRLELENIPRKEAVVSRGTIVLLAGLGGPDAVRQFLGALPGDFAPTVFVHQQLDGAATTSCCGRCSAPRPCRCCWPRPASPRNGHVYLVPGDIGVVAGGDGLRFAEGAHAFSQLTPGDNAIVALSGTDPALVEAIMAQSWPRAGAGATSPAAATSPPPCRR